MTDEHLQFVVAAFSGRKRARSSVYRWMLDRYEALAQARLTKHRIDWIGVTSELHAAGLRGEKNKPLKPENVRRTWHRLETDIKTGVVTLPTKQATAPPSPPIRERSERKFSSDSAFDIELPDITGKKI